MKIGILTIFSNWGYGSIMQAFALQRILRNNGYDAITFKFKESYELPLKVRYLIYLKRIFLKYVFGKKITIFHEKKRFLENKIISQNTEKFISKNINHILINNVLDINKNDFDAIIVGSDQVWRPKYIRNIEEFFLSFAKDWNIKRIAYAASFGVDYWEFSKKQTQECQLLIKSFDKVSVRELDAIKLCENNLNYTPEFVLDPTLLLEKNDYISLFSEFKHKSSGNLKYYFLDATQDKMKLCENIAEYYGLTPFHVYAEVENQSIDAKDKILPYVEEWLKGFYDAEFVVTDSFHGCVFSIIFNKPFVVYANRNRGISRFESLLSIFHLENRMIFKSEEWKNISKNIDWESINVIREKYKKKSIKFLLNSLENI